MNTPNRAAVDLTLGLDEAIKVLAEDNHTAARVLKRIAETKDGINTFLDIIDMDLRGTQIEIAWDGANSLQEFIEQCARRDADMINFVNAQCGEPLARRHGPQKRVNPVDFAVQSALAAHEMGTVERLDEGAEAVHNFFLVVLRDMQARKNFVANMTVNLGLESGYSAKFAIQLVELLDKDGKPIERQPTLEDTAIVAATPLDADTRRDLDEILTAANEEPPTC